MFLCLVLTSLSRNKEELKVNLHEIQFLSLPRRNKEELKAKHPDLLYPLGSVEIRKNWKAP